jgi:acyl-CoA thioesterase-2
VSDPAQELIALLDLEYLDVDLYRGSHPASTRQRVYGGQVAAQALVAGARSVPEDFAVHSLHSYFLRPGDYQVPVIYEVERIRDGRSFATRRVMARQHGRPIYYQTLSFQRDEDGFDHQDVMPDVKAPEHGVDLVELMRGGGNEEADALGKEWAALDVRWLGNSRHGLDPDPDHPSRAQMWIKIRGEMGDSPLDHLAAFTYASDVSLLGASLAAHPTDPSSVQMASLDHAVWFHRPFRVDDWWLYDQTSPSASGARGFSVGRVFTQDGTLVASVAQEGLIRPRTR